MNPATRFFSVGSVMWSAKLRTDRMNDSSPGGKAADKPATKWLKTMSSLTKYLP